MEGDDICVTIYKGRGQDSNTASGEAECSIFCRDHFTSYDHLPSLTAVYRVWSVGGTVCACAMIQ